ncbi:hypothetical protein Trco_002450 [Trichoderma cornu-damae]|uniref:CFEM domain-containing protein n=1 Tax=Trichoderma cornu-damae TaxID=654480 RepID=A0A9P8QPV7_9HYPO|nr:hypothetical protein Trco_002450 [Trichoderma cornu-damae]
MKITLVIAALIAAVYGQTVDDIPACAIPCIEASITKVTSCAVDDYACACKSFDDISADALNCVVAACTLDVATKFSRLFKLFALLSEGFI